MSWLHEVLGDTVLSQTDKYGKIGKLYFTKKRFKIHGLCQTSHWF